MEEQNRVKARICTVRSKYCVLSGDIVGLAPGHCVKVNISVSEGYGGFGFLVHKKSYIHTVL